MRVGLDCQSLLPTGGAGDELRRMADRIADAGIELVNFGDHISFRNGTGFDGLINAAAMLASHPSLTVQVGAYQLPARHPVLVARQLASIAELAPGRLVFGCGVGGEDRNELAMAGVHPGSRGRRMDEALTVLRRLLSGEPVDHSGEFFQFEDAWIQPAPEPAIPILIAGRSDAALERTVHHGDGWLAIWVSARRFAAAVNQITESAQEIGREPPTRHALNVWCGFDDAGRSGEDRLRVAMEELYGLPFDRFAKWCPTGTPEQIAAELEPYRAAGCKAVILVSAGLSADRAIERVGQVRELLGGGVPEAAG